MRLNAAEIAAATGGDVLAGDPGAHVTSYSIDSRTLAPGACFVALRGARDGHEFVGDALDRGATVVVVARPVRLHEGTVPRAAVRVADPLVALGDLGRLARSRLATATVVGITGSAGKTAAKDLLGAALRRTCRVHASPASFNNEAGLPLTLLAAREDTDVVITEMGARFAGNIAELCSIARPNAGVVTNVGLAHAGPLGGAEGVAAAKGEILERLPDDGLAVLNADDPATPGLAQRTRARVLRAGLAAGADVRAVDVSLDDELRPSFRLETTSGESIGVELGLRGEHQVVNAALAAAVALDLGAAPADVAAGLAEARAAAWRMQLTRSRDGIVVLNDAYNASPTSTAAALRALARVNVAGRRIVVLGEMLDLGDEAERAHAEAGRLAVETGVDLLVVVGAAAPAARGAREAGAPVVGVVEVTDAEAALEVLARQLHPGDAVLVKASRAVGLERVALGLVGPGAAA